jgi:NAD(P)-dependent dehydrogenase (short-subunit alcohol dehydrogenase family)
VRAFDYGHEPSDQLTFDKERREHMPSVLVTGAGRGIGLAITEHMSQRGWDVYATARSDAALRSLDRLPNVHPIPLEVTDRSAIAALPDQLPAGLNGVVNNVGIMVNGPVEGLSIDDLERQLDVNVIAQIAVTQAVLPKIREARGRVVFISSVSGLITTPGTGAYNASKYAIESLGDALRMELRPWKIPVSLIEPGPIRTDMWGDVLDEYDRMTKQLTDEHRELYAAHLVGSRKLLGRMQKLAGDPKRVSKAVNHALTSRRPKRRYLLDIASRAQKAVFAITPSAINDAVLAAATTSKWGPRTRLLRRRALGRTGILPEAAQVFLCQGRLARKVLVKSVFGY